MQVNETNFQDLHEQALTAARKATEEFLAKHGERDLCGFAWCTVYNVKGNTKLGRALIKAGFRKAYQGGLQLWNPSGSYTQAITAKEEGARAYADVLRAAGLTAYEGSRLD